jgi:putative acetyltransferase
MIRKMVPADIDTIMSIWLAGNLDAHSFIPASYWHRQFSAVKTAIQQATVYCYCDTNDKILGFIGLTDNYIAGLFVSKGFRRQGIGKQLSNAAKQDNKHLELDAYLANHNAISFYQQNGFKIIWQAPSEVRMCWSQNRK